MSQSLIHQVSVSDTQIPVTPAAVDADRLNPLFIRSQFQIFFWRLAFWGFFGFCLNPLFIRSQFQMNGVATPSLIITSRLNPLFIRSQFQIAAFFQPINTDSYNGLFCNLSFLSLFSSLHHLISHLQ